MLRSPLLLILLLFLIRSASSQNKLETPLYDSILKFRSLSKNNKLTLDEQFDYAKKAVDYSERFNIDSIIIRSNHNYSALCLYTDNSVEFYRINRKNLSVSKKISDSLTLAIANHNLGWYHHRNRNQNDSAYFHYIKAYKISEQLNLKSRQIEILINLSEIQKLEKDYIGSEDSAIKGIRLAENLTPTDYNLESLWLLYNRLGNVATTLKMFDKAIEYHQIAYKRAERMDNGLILKLSSDNNIALVYKEKGDLKTALSIYQSIIDQKALFDLDPNFYALVLDNLAFVRFLNGDQDFKQMDLMFERSYHISDSLDNAINKLNVSIDLSKYYKGQGKHEQAVHYALQSYQLANETSSNDILLESMLILSELKSGEEGKAFLKEHIKLSDSLLAKERSIRNKFARIEFETDQIALENERIATEKMWWIISSLILLLTSLLVYIIISQRNKNNSLKFKQDQQETNEEIYNLMLSQQDRVDGARAEEKKRISQELHDGVLGRLFGTRLSLDSYNFNEGKEGVKVRAKYITELKTIEDDIRKISHDLNTDFVSGSGFMDILTELIDKQARVYLLDCKFDFTDDINWEGLANKTKINMYRMVQESLQNIYKHAKAKRVKISIELKKTVICLFITDDGVGFDTHKSKKGIGLRNIHSRVKELNGTVAFQSEIDKGTTIHIKIPYIT